MGKFLVILACCAVAHAQFGSSQFGSSQFKSVGQSPSAFGNSRFQNQQTRGGQFQQSSIGNQNQANQYQQNQYQKNQYQQNEYQQQSAPKAQGAGSCRESNARYPVSGSCDRYVECINGTSTEKLCPDGLRFNPNVNFNVYPCQYPNDVPCLERSSLQPPQPTADCPNQFGYYRLGDARNCGSFKSCVNGVAFEITCPEGLAYSSETYRCEWPDEVADCDAEAFLGFRCPEVPVSKELGPPAGFRFYRSDADCQKYFICINNRPRLLTCGGDSGFDELTSTCVLADEVSSCPAELREIAARSREAEEQRLAKQLKFDSKPPQQKGRF